MNLELSVVVPDKVFLNENIKEIILPTLTGKMGVLKGHIPLLTGLDTGLILIRKDLLNSTAWTAIVISGGFALINNNVVTVLVNEAELGSEIDREEAEKEFLFTKSYLENCIDEKAKIKALSQFKKARAKMEALQPFN